MAKKKALPKGTSKVNQNAEAHGEEVKPDTSKRANGKPRLKQNVVGIGKRLPSRQEDERRRSEGEKGPDPTPVRDAATPRPTTSVPSPAPTGSTGEGDEQRRPPTGVKSASGTGMAPGRSVLPASPASTHRSPPTGPTTATAASAARTGSAVPGGVLGKFLSSTTPPQKSSAVPHMEVPALAGTGKTTSMVQGLIAVKGGKPSITPSEQQEEIWRQLALGKSDTVRCSAYNNSITKEMGHKLEEAGLTRKGVECKGIHSLGYGAVNKAFGYQKPDGDVTKDLVCKVMDRDPRDVRADKKLRQIMHATADLVGLCKQTMTDPDSPDFEQDMDALVSRHEVEMESPDVRDAVYELVPKVMERAMRPAGFIHWDDMVWLPNVLDLPIWKSDVQIVDEAQDLNRMQQELIYKAGRRIIYVGDRHQAIYGFAGADSESMDRMRSRLSRLPCNCGEATINTPHNIRCNVHKDGLVTCPLTVTRRCGKAIVREAQRYVPEFEAHESNCEGSVSRAPWTWKGRGADRESLPWEKTYAPLVKDGAMVLCRTNAPCVSECFRFLKRGIKATILGRSVGAGLIKFIRRAEVDTVVRLVGWMSDWQTRETDKENAKRFPSESKLQTIFDQVMCVTTFCEGLTYIADVIAKIESVFADKKCPKCGRGYDVGAKNCENVQCHGAPLILPPGIKFSSIHKSKGLEARQVFYLRPPESNLPEEKMQQWEREQEENLRYVAVTRAIEELVYVQ